MLRPKKIGLLVAAALLFCLGIYLLRHEAEPRFKGKTLSYWLDRFDYDSCFVDGAGRRLPAWEEDVQALRAIGTNVLPGLIRQLEKRDSQLKTDLLQRARRWYGPIPVANRRTINFFKTDFDKKRDAFEVLSVLKEQAAPAVPQLIALLDSLEDSAAHNVAKTLADIGSPAVSALPTLIAKLKQRKQFAFQAIAGLGPAAKPAVPVLIPFLRDRDANCRLNATFALGRIVGPTSPEALPELISSLSDSNDGVRANAVWAIGKIGVRNETVIQKVSLLTNDSAVNVRKNAERVLERLLSAP